MIYCSYQSYVNSFFRVRMPINSKKIKNWWVIYTELNSFLTDLYMLSSSLSHPISDSLTAIVHDFKCLNWSINTPSSILNVAVYEKNSYVSTNTPPVPITYTTTLKMGEEVSCLTSYSNYKSWWKYTKIEQFLILLN